MGVSLLGLPATWHSRTSS